MTTDNSSSYSRIRKEIAAYDDIARRHLEGAIEAIALDLFGGRLLGEMSKGSPLPGFPYPASLWLDSQANALSQMHCYRWLAPLEGKAFLQLGGSGSHAIKALAAGASRAVLLTPMAEEAALARRIARYLGLSGRLEAVQAIGEQIPLADGTIDCVFGGGTLHHVQLDTGLPEIARVLRPGGRAAFADPNLNFIYRFLEVTRIRDIAREPGAQCYPLRVSEVIRNVSAFSRAHCVLSGGPIRYALVGMTRVLKMKVSPAVSLRAQTLETRVLSGLGMRCLLGGLAVLLEK